MRKNILSLFLGVGIWGALLASPVALCAQEDMSEYDIDLDLTLDHINYEKYQADRYTIAEEKFSNEEHGFTASTGCVTGDGYLCGYPSMASAKPSLPIAVKGHNLFAGTYDIYVVVVPYYYKTGMAPAELPENSILQNKVRVEVSYLRELNSTREYTAKSDRFIFEGTKVDTLLVLQDFEFPVSCYQSYEKAFPTITVTDEASNSDIRKGFTRELRVDRILLKAKSVTPGNMVFEGSCGENITYKLDAQTRTLTFSGSGELQQFPVFDEFVTSEIGHIVIDEGITGLGEGVFAGKTLGQISFPNSLKHIGKKAFYASHLIDLTLPSSVETIADSAFHDAYLQSIELPEGIKTIGDYAFSCSVKDPRKHEHLEHIKLPNSLESIGKMAFGGLLLSEIDLPIGIQTIGDSAFFNTDLIAVRLPENAKTFGEDLFANTPLHKVRWDVRTMDIESADPFRSIRAQIDTLYLGEAVETLPNGLCQHMRISGIVIPEGVQTIGKECFAECPIDTVNIPASVVSIGTRAFTAAKDFNVAAGNTAYTDVDGVLFSKDQTELVCYPHARIFGYHIPDGVEVISDWAFGTNELTNVHIPASVKTLSLDVFRNVRIITTEWTKVEELPILIAFDQEDGYPFKIQVPHGSKEVYQQTDGWKGCTIVYEFLVGNALAEKPTMSVFRQMLEATGWDKALTAIEDEEYYTLYNSGIIQDLSFHPSMGQVGTIPARRYYGFTLFAERNAVFETLLGKTADAITLNDLTSYLATQYEGKTDEDYTSEEHVLNRFVSYHLLPVKLPKDKLVIHYNELGYDYANPESRYTIPVMEYYETMGKGRRLMKMSESAASDGVRINRFVKTDRNTGYELTEPADGVEGIRINKEDAENGDYLNGYVYALDELLVYSNEVRGRLSGERMRYDVAALLPELANNDLRRPMSGYTSGSTGIRGFSNDYPYFENLTIKPYELELGLLGGIASVYYLSGYGCNWMNYQGDEFSIVGNYDFTIKLPAVPESGIYELRMGTMSSQMRGIVQAFFGADKDNLAPCGLPIDMRKGGEWIYTTAGSYPSDACWVADGFDEVSNQIQDFQMRENGYMKGSRSYSMTQTGRSARDDARILRRIIGQFQLEAGETYYLRFKTCMDGGNSLEFFMDFIEWVPKKVYDNLNEVEDPW